MKFFLALYKAFLERTAQLFGARRESSVHAQQEPAPSSRTEPSPQFSASVSLASEAEVSGPYIATETEASMTEQREPAGEPLPEWLPPLVRKRPSAAGSYIFESDFVPRYLERIGYSGSTEPTLETLRALQQAHLLSVPFENLDILAGRPIILSVEKLFHKIVERERGGFCYELNTLFAELLHRLGFSVSLLSAEVAHRNGTFGPEYDHLTLEVRLDTPWLVDVGFGESFPLPLPIGEAELAIEGRSYRIDRDGELYTLQWTGERGVYRNQYRFTRLPRTLESFAPRCDYCQVSPHSHFNKERICMIQVPGGQLRLRGNRLTQFSQKGILEREVRGPDDLKKTLGEHYGLHLS